MAEGDFRVGRVLSRSLSILWRSLPRFSALSLFVLLPIAIVAVIAFIFGGALRANPGNLLWFGIVGAGFMVVVIGSIILSQAMVMHAAFQSMRGRPVGILQSMGVALHRTLPLLGIVVAWLGVMLIPIIALGAFVRLADMSGLSPLIGLVLGMAGVAVAVVVSTMWFVSVPACVVETKGVFASFVRSARLTKGHRWKSFGLMLLLVLLSIAVSLPVGMALDVVSTLALGDVMGGVLSSIFNLAWNVAWAAYYAVVAAVTYHDLRVAKEGVGIEDVASVFD
jgi:hypothetical protein